MINLLKMTIPSYAISYLIFYFLYKKLGGKKLINYKTSKRLILFFIAFISCFVGVSITDSFDTTKVYHSLFIGLFLGPSTALASFMIPINDNKTKS